MPTFMIKGGVSSRYSARTMRPSLALKSRILRIVVLGFLDLDFDWRADCVLPRFGMIFIFFLGGYFVRGR